MNLKKSKMFEEGELVNLVVSSILIVYLITLLRNQNRSLRNYWVYAIFFIMASQLFTVLEGFLLGELFNLLEHFSFTVACLLLLTSILKKEL